MSKQPERKRDAIALLTEVINALEGPDPNLLICVRKCFRAAQLLGWAEQSSWLGTELSGYSPQDDVPTYRTVSGLLAWRASKAMDFSTLMVAQPDECEPVSIQAQLRASLADLIAQREGGYETPTGKTKTVRAVDKWIEVKEVEVIRPVEIHRTLAAIADSLFKFATEAIIVLKYGETVASVFDEYRALVDTKLLQMGIGDSLKAAYDNVTSDNPDSWSMANLACRRIITKLADTLWKAPDRTHPILKEGDDDKPMSLARDKEKNRLLAYIHQKVESRSQKHFFKRQAERLTSLVHDLYALGSKGKHVVTYEQALSCLINTYVFLGDLAIFTDMEPVTKIQVPE